MKIPQLRRKLEVKNYHGFELRDDYSWIHQENILEVLKDGGKLLPEVRAFGMQDAVDRPLEREQMQAHVDAMLL